MQFGRLMPAAALLATASAHLPVVGAVADLDLAPAVFDLATSLENEILFEGLASLKTKTEAAVELSLHVNELQVEGEVSLEALSDFLKEPSVRLDLGGVKAYVQIDLSASAAVHETIELIASPQLELDTKLAEAGIAAAFALDLVICAGAAIDLTAGFYVSFSEGDYIDLSLITKDIVGSKLVGLVAKALPIGVGAEVDLSAAVEVQLGLRLRSHIKIGAEVGLLGLDVLEAGAEVAIWADLLTHTIVLVETSGCVLSVDQDFVLALGIAVDVAVEALEILDLSLAPEVTVKIAKTIVAKVCLPDRGIIGDFIKPVLSGTIPALPTITSIPDSVVNPDDLVTITTSTIKEYTITSCHASVINCPGSSTQVIVTSTTSSYVTVCPGNETEEPATSTKPTKPVHSITETLTTIVPCEPTSSTYVPPVISSSIPPTLTITDTPGHPTDTVEIPTGSPTGEVPEESSPATTEATVTSMPTPESTGYEMPESSTEASELPEMSTKSEVTHEMPTETYGMPHIPTESPEMPEHPEMPTGTEGSEMPSYTPGMPEHPEVPTGTEGSPEMPSHTPGMPEYPEVPTGTPEMPEHPEMPTGTPEMPEHPEMPTGTYGAPEVPVESPETPYMPIESSELPAGPPATTAVEAPKPTSPGGAPVYPMPGSTMISMTTPHGSTWVPGPTGSPSVPTQPATAGAGSFKVGVALALPAIAALLL